MSIFRGLRTLLVLGRISNLPTIWTNVAVGWFLCGGGWTAELGWIALGISFLYLAGMTLNDAFDANWDREHAPDRPIPYGLISHRAVWSIGILETVTGVACLQRYTSVHPLLIGALIISILLYNILHKHWKGSVLIMGLCRALVYVGAGSAVVAQTTSIEVSGIVYIVAIAVVFYIAGITLAARSEHLGTPTGLSYGNRILLTLPVLFPLLGSRIMPDGPVNIALVVVGVLGTWSWLVITRTALREKVPRGIAYAIAGIAFFDAAVVVFADWKAAVACLLCFAITLLAQRYIPAT